MLVLDRRGDAYPDDGDDTLRYRLPVGLKPLPGPDGVPQAVVARSQSGGLLQLRLGALWPPLGPGERRATFADAQFQLRLRTPTGEHQNGDWHRAAMAGDQLVDRSLSLDPVEAAIARRLVLGGNEVVEIDVALHVRGLTPTYPWLVRGDTEMLLARIDALLESTTASWEAVEEAFLGLSPDTFTWYPLESGAVPLPPDAALAAIARHATPRLFESTDHGWVLRAGGPPHTDISLAVAQVATESVGLRWSFSEFLQTASDPTAHLVDISTPAPFEAADLHVVNDVPLDVRAVSNVSVEVATGGPTGIVRHQFRPNAPAAARLRFVLETFDDLDLRWRARATVSTSRGPATLDANGHTSELMLQITPATFGINVLRFAATNDVFDHIAALLITIGSRTLELTAASPDAWAVGRAVPAAVEVAARLPNGTEASMGDFPVGHGGLTLDAADLGVAETVYLPIRTADDVAARAAYVAVQVEGGPWRTVDPGAELVWPVRRNNRFESPALRYRTRHVPLTAGGATLPIVESAWRDGGGDAVVLNI